MSTRQLFIILGIATVAGAIFLSRWMINSKVSSPAAPPPTAIKLVKIQKASNADIIPETSFLATVQAQEKIELFAEVNGLFIPGGFDFREGNKFAEGEAVIRIDSDEARMNLLAQKTSFLNLIANSLADIRLDFPESYPVWEEYVDKFDEKKPLAELPLPASKKEKVFQASKNLSNQYYQIKAAEARLDKYTIVAPFQGMVVLAGVRPGSLVRAGQKLGEIISTDSYEIEGAVRIQDLEFISAGDSVVLTDPRSGFIHRGKLSRVSDNLDPATQTVKVFAKVTSSGLKDGMYLEGRIFSEKVANCIRVNRNVIIGDSLLYAVADSVLTSFSIEVVRTSEERALVRGVPDGAYLLSEPISNAYPGMHVKIQE
jgi:multidrug efflux pump subunit AcrA (membrane-fusion protein)